MKQSYLSQWDIQQMAEAALINYEFSCSWEKANETAIEFAANEWEIKATQAQAATATNIAKTGWDGIKQSVKKVIYQTQ
jgi:hypothetical protein